VPAVFESCAEHDLECLRPDAAPIELADVAVVALHWAARRTVRGVVGGLADD
jgi:hypothetical protein